MESDFVVFLKKNKYPLLFTLVGIIHFLNLFIDIMNVDAAQYASISMEMGQTKNYAHIYNQGQDYLDKPPLLFWISSLSILLFGPFNFAYKLPSLLAAILGVYSLYRFTKIWYKKEVALISALILASCQAMFLMTNDVRTDTMLLGFVTFSVWQLSEYLQYKKVKNFLLASIGLAFSLMTKGPIGLILPAAAFGGHLILKRDWGNIFKIQWLIMLAIVGILISPMLYGLYTQFDLHPEKTVYGLIGPSGIKFFFWTQSFGRITGDNYWQNDSGFFYFFHTILWDFMPWILLFIPALIVKLSSLLFRKGNCQNESEFISLSGFVLVFLALSLSKYKLPHYIFVLMPFASVITAHFLINLKAKRIPSVSTIQFVVMNLLWLLIPFIFIYVFPPHNLLIIILAILFYTLFWLAYLRFRNNYVGIVAPTALATIALNITLTLHFYPNLLRYQPDSEVGKYIVENTTPNNNICTFNIHGYALNYYARRIIPIIEKNNLSNLKANTYIYTDKQGLETIERLGINYKMVKTFPNFKVTALNKNFVLKKSRDKAINFNYLIRF
jgi:4-amino-4-deoxy-L-arabinose transferase-like glycosyltransferase